VVCKGKITNTSLKKLKKERKEFQRGVCDLRKVPTPSLKGAMIMIIKVCVLKSLSGALLKGGKPTAPSPSPGKTSSMRRLA
jgi:hypothetical protein